MLSEAVPPTASATSNEGGHRSQRTATQSTAAGSAEYSYANPNRVIFSLPPPTSGTLHEACPNTRLQEPKEYEVPQPAYGSTGNTARHSVKPPVSKEQLSHTGAAIATQPLPRSSVSPTRPDKHPEGRCAGPSPEVIQHFTSSPPALPPKGIRFSSGPASHSGKDEWSAHYKLSHTPDPRGDSDHPLSAADGDSFPILPQPKSITLAEDTVEINDIWLSTS